MINEQLKKGTFRWRKKFRHKPTREQLAKERELNGWQIDYTMCYFYMWEE